MNEIIEEQDIAKDKELQLVGLELMFSNPQKRESDIGLTAVELAKKLSIKIDIVKKKLKILYDKELIRCIGVNPKYWIFDEYKFQRMDVEDPVYLLLCDYSDVDFDQYFDY